MKSDFRSESFKRKFSTIFFVYNLIIGCSIRNRKNCPIKAFEQRNKGFQNKIQPWVGANRPSKNWAQVFSQLKNSFLFVCASDYFQRYPVS